ncbi:choice-of-anchor M domain-containing protein [Streptomyces halstedii]|uniref:choice-of-anchor M domain-containing protein n=1 Tax=Streptomyces halstedii TaxID=1944 RepID=UPI0037FA6701
MTTALTRGSRPLAIMATAAGAAVFIGAAGLVAGGSGTARAAGGPVVIEDGAIDLVPRLVDTALRLQLDDHSGGAPVVRDPSEVVVHAGPATKEEVISPAYPVVGERVDAYFLNGFLNAGRIYAPEPGWKGGEAGGDTEVRLAGFDGPDTGLFALYTYTPEMDADDASAVQHLGSDDGAPHSFTLPDSGERTEPTWAFTQEGVYRLTFTVTAGGRSDTETLAVVVGDDVDPASVVPGDGTTPTEPPDGPTPTPTATPTRPPAHVIDNGHLDLAARPAENGLAFQIKEGTSQNYAWHEPGTVVLHVKPAAKRKIEEGYAFLGEPGDPVWLLPMRQVDGLVWPGWSTEEFTTADVRGDVSFRLDSVQGPGSVAVFSTGATGGVSVGLDSRDGLPDELHHSAHAHSHWNWTFTAEGVYRTTFTVGATLADGRTVSDTETLAWVVGNGTDPSTVVPGDDAEPTPAPTSPEPSATVPTPSVSDTPPPSASPPSSAAPPGPTEDAGPVPVPEASHPATTGRGAGPANASGSGGGSAPAGGLAATGSGAAVVAGGALAALVAGSGAFIAARRRRTAR